MTRTHTQLFGVMLTLVCLVQQWGAACHCPMPEACQAQESTHLFADTCHEHSQACGHSHDEPTPTKDRSHDHAPLHLCSAAHAFYLVTTAVEIAGTDAAPRWIGTSGDENRTLVLSNVTPSHGIQTSFDHYLSAALRAQREILRL